MARVKEDILESNPPTVSLAGHLGNLKKKSDRDPLGQLQPHRRTLPDDVTVQKALTFNTYIEQIEDPRSFLNLLPEGFKEAVTTIPQDLVNADEDELLRILEERYNYKPTAALEAMRNNFWMEHDRVSTTKTEVMNQSTIYLGIVSRPAFHQMLTSSPHMVAYMLCRSPEYEAVMRGLLNLSTRKIRDVLNLPLKKADGSIQDPKIIELVLKAAAMVDLRAKGGYVQRSETKNLNLIKQTSYTSVFHAASSGATDMSAITQDIDEKLAALEKELSASPGLTHMQTTEPSQQKQEEPTDADFKETF